MAEPVLTAAEESDTVTDLNKPPDSAAASNSSFEAEEEEYFEDEGELVENTSEDWPVAQGCANEDDFYLWVYDQPEKEGYVSEDDNNYDEDLPCLPPPLEAPDPPVPPSAETAAQIFSRTGFDPEKIRKILAFFDSPEREPEEESVETVPEAATASNSPMPSKDHTVASGPEILMNRLIEYNEVKVEEEDGSYTQGQEGSPEAATTTNSSLPSEDHTATSGPEGAQDDVKGENRDSDDEGESNMHGIHSPPTKKTEINDDETESGDSYDDDNNNNNSAYSPSEMEVGKDSDRKRRDTEERQVCEDEEEAPQAMIRERKSSGSEGKPKERTPLPRDDSDKSDEKGGSVLTPSKTVLTPSKRELRPRMRKNSTTIWSDRLRRESEMRPMVPGINGDESENESKPPVKKRRPRRCMERSKTRSASKEVSAPATVGDDSATVKEEEPMDEGYNQVNVEPVPFERVKPAKKKADKQEVVGTTPRHGASMDEVAMRETVRKSLKENEHMIRTSKGEWITQEEYEYRAKGRCEEKYINVMDDSIAGELERMLTKSKRNAEKEKEENEDSAPPMKRFYHSEEVYEVERIVAFSQKRFDRGDKAILVVWGGKWNLTSSTWQNTDDVYGSEQAIREYISYASAVEKVIKYLKKQGQNPKQLEIELFSRIYGGTWLKDEEYEEEKRKKTFAQKAGYWYLKHLEQGWNKAYGYPDYAVSGLIRVDNFFEEHVKKFPDPFKFVAESRLTTAAADIASKMAVRPPECKCSCNIGICDFCYLEADAEPCILRGNRITNIKNGGERSRTFCAYVCPKNIPCHSAQDDGTHQTFPNRQFPILVAYQPRVKGMGIFAITHIEQWTVLCEYVGELSTVKEAAEKSYNYQMSVPGTPLVIDAAAIGNESRFANHSCGPNTGVLLLHEGHGKAVPRIFYVALRDIKIGEEIVVDYHPTHHFQDKARPQNASNCNCGHKECRTYL